MSIDLGNLCSEILKIYFGDVVQKVGDCLFTATSRTLNSLVTSTNLKKDDVAGALLVLIKFDLVEFEPSSNNYVAQYRLKHGDVRYILRYARYVYIIQKKYGETAMLLFNELVQAGIESASALIIKCMKVPDSGKLEDYREKFIKLVQDHYIMRCPQVIHKEDDLEVPKFNYEPNQYFLLPEFDLLFLNNVLNGQADLRRAKDKDICWKINHQRFHQDMRDEVMINAVEVRMGTSAAECINYILQLMYKTTDPWQKDISNPISVAEIKQTLERKSLNIDLIRYVDQYVSLIADDSVGFLKRVGEMGCGQYAVYFSQCFEQLAFACIENVILDHYGAKASRIFRVIRQKKFIDQDDLQKEAMVQAKEAKLLTYTLFQDQFVQIRPIRKAGGGGSGPAKAFFLYYIKPRQVIQMLLNTCYKALNNVFKRSNYERGENKLVLDKADKLSSIVESLRDRGESDEYVDDILDALTPPERKILDNVQHRLKKLSKAVVALDNTILIFEMYMYHSIPNT